MCFSCERPGHGVNRCSRVDTSFRHYTDVAVTTPAPWGRHSLRRRWPKAVFRTMRKWLLEVERLRRHSCHHPELEFRHYRPGFWSLCQEQVTTALGT